MLVRLRADPKRVRIGVRKVVGGWRVSVYDIEGKNGSVVYGSDDPCMALEKALSWASIPGLDPGSYDHPQSLSSRPPGSTCAPCRRCAALSTSDSCPPGATP